MKPPNGSAFPPVTNSEVFVSDTPVTDPQLDRFQRSPFAERVARILAIRQDSSSIVILIHGRWGEGKTTVLEYIHGALFKFDNVVPVRFNPWFFSDETSLLVSFFGTLATALDKSPKTAGERLGHYLRKYGDVIGEISIEANGAKLSPGKAVSTLGEKLSTLTIDAKRERISKMLSKSGKRVVVFLDDIDRLDRKEVQAVFKLLKLTADFQYVSYVLAFDRDVVAAAIGEQYGAGNKEAGHEYLEKIVQVNLDLPVAPADSLAQLCTDAIDDALRAAGIVLSADQKREFDTAFLQYVVPGLDTPRLAKLYANAVAFVLPLLAHEVNPVDILLLEAVKFVYPQIHADIRNSPEIYTGDFGWDWSAANTRGERSDRHLRKLLEQFDKRAADRAQHLLIELFPQLGQLFRLSKYGERSEERLRREQRIAAPDYLWRYLTCSIPDGDISDQEIRTFLDRIGSFADDELENQYHRLLRPNKENKLFLKIKAHVDGMTASPAERLCLAIARNGSLLPEVDGIVHPIGMAGFLIRLLLQRVELPRRKQVALEVLQRAEPLQFAAWCLDSMRPGRGEEDGPFSLQEIDELIKGLAKRITEAASHSSLITGQPEAIGLVFSIWQQGVGSVPVKNHVKTVLAKNPHAATVFIIPFSSLSRTGTVGMDQAGYDFLLNFVEPDVLMSALDASRIFDMGRADGAARIAEDFANIYRQRKA
jgi:hypothetical protein